MLYGVLILINIPIFVTGSDLNSPVHGTSPSHRSKLPTPKHITAEKPNCDSNISLISPTSRISRIPRPVSSPVQTTPTNEKTSMCNNIIFLLGGPQCLSSNSVTSFILKMQSRNLTPWFTVRAVTAKIKEVENLIIRAKTIVLKRSLLLAE